MNVSVKLLFLGLSIACLNSSVSAQSANSGSSASANVTATLISPLTIVKKLDMNFGSVSVNGTNGSVVLSCTGTVTPAGGCAVITSGTSSPSQASFDVTGDGTDSFTITLPTNSITLNSAGTLTVGTWYTPTKTFSLVSGTATTIPIGATLNVVAGTSTGTYTLANGLAVSVNYN